MAGRKRTPLDSGSSPGETATEEPFEEALVRQATRELLETGRYLVSGHAKKRMYERGITMTTVANALRGGLPPEGRFCSFEHGSWRYCLETTKHGVVVAFRRDLASFVLITVYNVGEPR